ncbi:methylated-DNA--[protein]-cysteine S-methyltransferase [Ralstonia solanacearum]|uniref:methylated-DNA--[protein]-cysteine S-methyltransferase n=1 Tax=Ralstonia solanacearum TaxID=305 RepID=UPI000F60AF71|nr:methylated-DNA--[protein]-cysteine S-methyltransferase [Ralstonia solanacearum]MCL9844848.1 methylated-DNA--[protein]-cysteine S-methyltransferase [Ralstonia solanacearum]MDC6252931.1 methylated-DNA--[protein]-cysteine S-methyltransferase [Ralstonia solanacearum]MDC6257513.1 methylated-DNA--[protein]-cysteine S-methyltransferase [Ralstonia solanacearum]MDC6301831.1 methylated-DNA--[protein]-cysteine S-methyltransferase [Ralstonia solanacearum]
MKPFHTPTLRYAAGASTLGHVLVAIRGEGVCALLLGDDTTALRTELAGTFPGAALIEDASALAPQLARAIALADAPSLGFNDALDMGGTPFQRAVWRALRDIPAGATVSYTEIAERIGRPGAVRAVAGACAANVLAIAVPCHRAVRADGGLAGYRWGLERKRALLQREAHA